MSPRDKNPEPAGDEEDGHALARDLIDFYRRWPEFRRIATGLCKRPELSAAERQTVRWLILLVDRVGEHDLTPPPRP